MRYLSTRGGIAGATFEEVLLTGLAPDGGLFVPEEWPRLGSVAADYTDVVSTIAELFGAGEGLSTLAGETYGDFDRLVPLTELGEDRWLLELFWGPTHAFKDYALQWLGRLLDGTLRRRGERLLVIGATSGDTGSAAIAAVAGLQSIDIVILHPHGRVSDVQRRQMTTVSAPNVHNIAIEGTFDDCQRIVKVMLMKPTRPVSSVNSINWVRVMGQIPYYAHAAATLGVPEVDVVVPTGNFGNVYSAWVARRMGVPIRRLVVGTNVNRSVVRFFEDGSIEPGAVVPTIAPAMDIQIPSNLERLVFELLEHDGARVIDAMSGVGVPGLDAGPFEAYSFDDAQILASMSDVDRRYGIQVDPHTAVAVAASNAAGGGTPTIVVGTAHPAKFPDAVAAATGRPPIAPPRIAQLAENDEDFTVLPATVDAVERFVTWKIDGYPVQ
jgi:threonine synthase